MLIENLNDPYKANEIRFNIKQRPSWMKDEKFQDDVLYGTLRSNSGCFVKILIKDADVKKEKKKKEVPVQQKLTERQIYEQKRLIEKQAIRTIRDLRDWFKQNV